ncbi:carboxypeptidase B-like [Epargyreus clarus]|uniref:carboxypeptidase B-like n=1 Tax=Epargyreus clarus TaxID=520877 RepID=UPI003C2CEDB4
MKRIVLLFLAAAVFAKHEQYAGWSSYYVEPSTPEQLKMLGALVPAFDLDFLAHATIGREGVVLVKPQYQAGFLQTLEKEGITYRVHVADVKGQLDFDDQVIETRKRVAAAKHKYSMPYDNYQTIDVIDRYLEDIANNHSDIVTLVSPNNSFEGHPIKYLKISSSNFEDLSKPVIFIDGGIHAREWISPASVTYAIHKLVEDLTEKDLVENYDWVLLPIVNPDGYKYTFNKSRFWRKTRSTDQDALGRLCPGVDGNRNYDFNWRTVGTSSNPCHDTFGGSRPFSEVETRVVKGILQEHLDRITLYISMHSYGSMILYPWGHDGTVSPYEPDLKTVGNIMSDAIKKKALSYFPAYAVGNSLRVIGYGASGGSDDYAHSIGVPLSYTIELPGLQGGYQGFHLDPQYIAQVCEETWGAIAAGARKSAELFGKRK